jgi:RNA polymerase sigma factor (sigma-70 family)
VARLAFEQAEQCEGDTHRGDYTLRVFSWRIRSRLSRRRRRGGTAEQITGVVDHVGVMAEATSSTASSTSGSDDGFTHLYKTERDRLRRVAYLMTGQQADAEEIVHDAFLRIHDRLGAVDSPAAYLRTTVVHLCLARRSRAALAARRTPPGNVAVELPELDETWHLLERLPRDQRVALVLRCYEDLSTDEIAQLTGCRPTTVRTRIHRALHKLRREMTQ